MRFSRRSVIGRSPGVLGSMGSFYGRGAADQSATSGQVNEVRGYNPPMEQGEQRMQSNPDLVAEIRGAIEREGCITFARFMQEALYHPRYGYYLSETVRP